MGHSERWNLSRYGFTLPQILVALMLVGGTVVANYEAVGRRIEKETKRQARVNALILEPVKVELDNVKTLMIRLDKKLDDIAQDQKEDRKGMTALKGRVLILESKSK